MSRTPPCWHALLQRTAQVHLVGAVPTGVPGAVYRAPLVHASRTQAMLSVPGVADYSIEMQGAVTAKAHTSTTPADLQCFLSGPVRALDLVLHAVPCLRASAVQIGGRAVLLCGASASGKSVLAAALAARGHRVLADGVAPVPLEAAGVQVLPTTGAVQLWPGARQRLALSAESGSVVRPGLAKRSCTVGSSSEAAEPLPLTRIIVLTADLGTTEITERPLHGGGARITALYRNEWHAELAECLDPVGHFSSLTTIASAVPFDVISRPLREWTFHALADRVEALAG